MCHLVIQLTSRKHFVFPHCWVQRAKQVCHLKHLHPSLSLIENWLKIASKRTLLRCFFFHLSASAHVSPLSGPRDTDGLLRAQPSCKWPQKVGCSIYTVWFSTFERQKKNGQCHVQPWALKVSKVCLNKMKKKKQISPDCLSWGRIWEKEAQGWIEFSLQGWKLSHNHRLHFIHLLIYLFHSRALLLIPFSYITSCH